MVSRVWRPTLLLIRQHNLDPTLVKAYAADFCGTASLKEANRDLVESFISTYARKRKQRQLGLPTQFLCAAQRRLSNENARFPACTPTSRFRNLMACFWFVWEERTIEGIPKSRSWRSDLSFWSRNLSFQDRSFFSRLYCTERALWRLHWFLRDFGYDADLLHRDQVDEKALLNLRGVIRTSSKL